MELPVEDDAVPMVYPYMTEKDGLHNMLIEQKIFVAHYWLNVQEWTTKEDIEYRLASQVQPLSIDQRYREEEMRRIIEVITNQ